MGTKFKSEVARGWSGEKRLPTKEHEGTFWDDGKTTSIVIEVTRSLSKFIEPRVYFTLYTSMNKQNTYKNVMGCRNTKQK